MQPIIKSVIKMPMLELANAVLANDTLRHLALKIGDKITYHILIKKNYSGRPHKVQEDKYYMVRSMLYAINKALGNKIITPAVRKGLLKNLLGEVLLANNAVNRTFQRVNGFDAPYFLLISPTKKCNLQCVGCYASSTSKDAEKLDFDTFNRIINEKRELWGSHFTVISGGEPFMWKSNGKDIIDMANKHKDNYFLIYTNGTLINKKIAKRMVEAGNITPAISVEGFEKETDARRGKGVHKQILKAFDNLRKYGVPFGISITATKKNAEMVVSDEFIDYYYEQQGAIYAWIFQYMPIGRSSNLDLMVTPEQRKWMFEKEQNLVRNKKIFIADFWNSGAVSNGCIAAGRPGGYFYIDWNGNCMPCAFYPFTVSNIHDIYKKGGDLNTALMSPFFKSIRKWQSDYGYMKPACEVGNQICPCAIKDHFRNAKKTIEETGAKPADEQAAQSLMDKKYVEGIIAYGDNIQMLINPIWEKYYIEPEKKRMEIRRTG